MIARDWNTPDEASGYAGYVLRFRVRSEFLGSYDVHTVDGRMCQEYWIPAGDLDRFNDAIIDRIEQIAAYLGPGGE